MPCHPVAVYLAGLFPFSLFFFAYMWRILVFFFPHCTPAHCPHLLGLFISCFSSYPACFYHNSLTNKYVWLLLPGRGSIWNACSDRPFCLALIRLTRLVVLYWSAALHPRINTNNIQNTFVLVSHASYLLISECWTSLLLNKIQLYCPYRYTLYLYI